MRYLGNIKIYITALLVMLAAASCDKTEVLPTEPVVQNVTLSASIATEDNGLDFKWGANDAVAVINNGKLYRFIVSDNTSDNKVAYLKMDRTLLPEDYAEGDFDTTSVIRAFYPYEGVAYDTVNRIFSYIIPTEQKYIINNVEKKLQPMVAYSTNIKDTVKFAKLFGILKLSIVGNPDETIKKIEVVSSNKINGLAQIRIEEGKEVDKPYVYVNILKNDGKEEAPINNNRVILNLTNEIQLSEEPVDFHIALPTSAKDLGILISTSATSYYKTISSYKENGEFFNVISAGKVFTLPQMDASRMIPAYIENGVYLGNGIILPKSKGSNEKLIWAPVNCGYESEKKDGGVITYNGYPFGKIYQWGRKDGQGYKDNVYEDATYPLTTSENNGSPLDPFKFYVNWSLSAKDWPTESNPCPDGWRVPTIEELISLVDGLLKNDYVTGLENLWVTSNEDPSNKHYGQPGFKFDLRRYDEYTKELFLPAAGFYKNDLNGTQIRGLSGCYWSSTAEAEGYAWYFDFNRQGYIDNYYDPQSYGRSVRCVKSM